MIKDNSHKKIEQTCELNISENCKKTYTLMHRDMIKTRKRNNGLFMCIHCSRKLKHSGNLNPNSKYKIDSGLFEKIDSEEKAYILGFIASDGHINKKKSSIKIKINKRDIDVLCDIKNFICKDIPISSYKNDMVSLTINSKNIANNICDLLQINGGKKSDKVCFPVLEKEFEQHFTRGYFDGGGHIKKNNYPECTITSNSKKMIESLREKYKGKVLKSGDVIFWSGNNCLDFLGKLYDNSKIKMNRKINKYFDISTWIPSLSGGGSHGRLPKIKWNKCKKNAVPPAKFRASDIGYDVTIIDIVKDLGETKLYGTGIKVTPDYGWYLDLVPRSSIIKTGYVMTNSVGIIDRSYNGEILVPLAKIDKNLPDIELPCRIAQLIPRPIINFDFIEVEDLETTERGDKGFGSSGK